MKSSTATLISSKRAAEAEALRVYGVGAKVYRKLGADGRGASVEVFNHVGAASADGERRMEIPVADGDDASELARLADAYRALATALSV